MSFIWKSLHNLLAVLKYFPVLLAPQNIIIRNIYVLAHGILVETLCAVHWTIQEFPAINAFRMPWFLHCLRTGLLIFSGVLISKNKLMYHRALGAEGIAAQCRSAAFSPFSHLHHQAQPCFQYSFAMTTSLIFPWISLWDTLKWYHQMSPIFFLPNSFLLSSFFQEFCLLHNPENSNIGIRKEAAWNGWKARLKWSNRFLTQILLQRLIQVNHLAEGTIWTTNLQAEQCCVDMLGLSVCVCAAVSEILWGSVQIPFPVFEQLVGIPRAGHPLAYGIHKDKFIH